ncbi:hypothetical protein MCAP1_000347 [Malassezia caprae]|uniref:HIT domain-containing protein n=1 Tax=Malassezia caprae TaxID=1381934 RepID=A0AAF0E3Y9_9BASI|nr:hypothetical protein MCAP1_000347 [Malassezia caprae]
MRLPRLLLARETAPWTMAGQKGSWNLALRRIAEKKDPSEITRDNVIAWDDHTYVIYDGYPKSQFHFLILPRIPFVIAEESPQGKKNMVTVPPRDMESIRSLLASRYAPAVLGRIAAMEQRYADLDSGDGLEWGVRSGFHAVPSMRHLHLHVISDDLVSDRLKQRKHYLSFHPRMGIWLPLAEAQALADAGQRLPHTDEEYEEGLRKPLYSLDMSRTYNTVPEIKQYLLERWRSMRVAPLSAPTKP